MPINFAAVHATALALTGEALQYVAKDGATALPVTAEVNLEPSEEMLEEGQAARERILVYGLAADFGETAGAREGRRGEFFQRGAETYGVLRVRTQVLGTIFEAERIEYLDRSRKGYRREQ